MMTSRPTSDQFDSVVRRALDDVTAATRVPTGLADRLIADVPAGRRPVTHLGTRRPTRLLLPMLAAAVIVAIAVAITVLANAGGHSHSAPPVQHRSTPAPSPSPSHTTPAPVGHPPVPHYRATDVSFADARHGWTLGDGKCPTSTRTNCPALLVTADGGQSWRKATLPAGLASTRSEGSCGTNGSISGPCVDNVLFANSSDGYLWSLHELYSTTDGGSHWTRAADPGHQWQGADQVAVFGKTAVRLAPINPCSAECGGMIQTAPLGSTHWTTTTPAHQQVGLYDSALVAHGSEIYLFAGGVESNASPGIYRSSDGRDWHLVGHDVCHATGSDQTDPFSGRGSAVADNGALIADCQTRTSAIRVAAPGSSVFGPSRALPKGDDTEVLAASTQHHIVAANLAYVGTGATTRATVYTSADGGQHWTATRVLDLGPDGPSFVSGSTGYALSADGTGYYSTDDGGVTWHLQPFNAR